MRRTHRVAHRRIWFALAALLPALLLAAFAHRAPAPADGAVRLDAAPAAARP